MPVGLDPHGCADRVAGLLDQEFAALLPRAVVRHEVGVAERELSGQVPDGALEELMHRLAAQRLWQRHDGASS
ncbi:hypothetical protein I4I73_10570 [Pseudonocardia sp. KRD-184]|uniref:Uncharacterized protein n=1 Tax=Pseudonocardia oceani TaxID=2792013 RepID=A0ABS6UHF0_9PSEU|nr:hypothetical protein [Pseudonocardia oceani]MBW0089425.1 hypothetical protein [Pseudonocardia oceani]MBW0096431.1 hypothetical protein [Pseudonocardia oceani]MBW0108748.1 hypothetical protein [Pseudonocardia oceani]MBW0122976.1 hypothetical protein [Pseudonocardia oceani]MBW0131249.1 hypothetical protein [Pseudonocardia oceani]